MDRAAYADNIAAVLSGAQSARVGYPIGLYEVEVLRTERLGSGLLRITFGGPELAGFHSYVADEHVRLIFPDAEGVLRLPRPAGFMLDWGNPRPVSREYTVRRHSALDRELDIDFALHSGGIASEWALAATPGTRMHIAGPPGGQVVPLTYDKYLFAGDITALPAIARWLEWLPREASGWAFIEVADAAEEIGLTPPPGIQVRWVHRGAAAPGTGDALEQAVRTVTVPEGERVYVWIAGEAGVLRPLRRWTRTELGVGPKDSLIAGYWKRGVADFDDEE
ncbi:siderophore-interacting protein [Nocardia sp. NPDC051570]|uniref:siderophore-interacting protein n=1 Tax=Nocardia sp. NPDC051570 TaxID=3364324 RepID=UPI0037A9991A